MLQIHYYSAPPTAQADLLSLSGLDLLCCRLNSPVPHGLFLAFSDRATSLDITSEPPAAGTGEPMVHFFSLLVVS